MQLYWTVADVVAEHSCLTEVEIRAYYGDHESLTIRQILDLPTLSDEYKVWMACRKGALPPALYTAWQTATLTRVITAYALPHPATHDWAVRWLDGTDRTTRSAVATAVEAWATRATWAAGVTFAAGTAWAAGGTGAARWGTWAVRAARARWGVPEAMEYALQIETLKGLLTDAETARHGDL